MPGTKRMAQPPSLGGGFLEAIAGIVIGECECGKPGDFGGTKQLGGRKGAIGGGGMGVEIDILHAGILAKPSR